MSSGRARKKATKDGMTPLDYLLGIMRDEGQDARSRLNAARAPYCHARLSSTKLSGPDGSAVQVQTTLGTCGSVNFYSSTARLREGSISGRRLPACARKQVKARRVGEFVFLDGAPDRRRHCGELVVGQVNGRHRARAVKSCEWD
jgi:hypothetical protein